jgi:hypothetical protein
MKVPLSSAIRQRGVDASWRTFTAMMHSEAPPPSARLDPQLPPPRDRLPTLPCVLDEYARLSCLPDEEDELIFTAGPVLEQMTSHIPHIVADRDLGEKLTSCEAVLLSLVDGVSPVSLLVQIAGTDHEEALVGMCDLYSRGLIAFY